MNMNVTTNVAVSTDVYANTAVKKTDSTKDNAVKADSAKVADVAEGVTYEKGKVEKPATYSVNKLSEQERSALVKQLKADQEEREKSLLNIVSQTLNKQAETFSISRLFGDNVEKDADALAVWRKIANGEFEVDEATSKQAQEDISEDGYWGIKQTAQRMFDFASALAGNDKGNMQKMQNAMMKGYEQAAKIWGKDMPQITQDTMDAANKLFQDYYDSLES